jgi:cobalt/nickel transport system permease protein
VALSALLGVLLSQRLGFPLLVLAVCAVWLAVRRQSRRGLLRRMIAALGLATLLCAMQTFLAGGTPLASIRIGPWRLAATREGLDAGLLIGSRVLASLALLLVVCRGASATEILAVGRWARLPRAWLEIAMLMTRYLVVLGEVAQSALAAQRARLGYASIGRGLRSLGTLAGIVVIRAMDQAENSYTAMLARGYHGTMPLPSLAPLGWRRVVGSGAVVACVAAAFFMLQRWPR